MTTNAIYERIIEIMPEGLGKRIMQVLRHHITGEHRISRPNLVRALFPVYQFTADAVIKTTSEDRQIRKTIQHLQDEYPVISDSGEGGYWLAEPDSEEFLAYIIELKSRRNKLDHKIQTLESFIGTAMILPPQEPVQPIQPSLF